MTLVQSASAVCVVGIVAAAGIPAFMRHLQLSKVSEAASQLTSMHRGAAAYFAMQHGSDDTRMTRCVPHAAGPTPAQPSTEPVPFDDGGMSPHDAETWSAIGFAPETPIRFRYAFEPVTSGCNLRSEPGTYLVTMRAEGDLDGDGQRSIFERRAAIDPATGSLVPMGVLYVRDRVE